LLLAFRRREEEEEEEFFNHYKYDLKRHAHTLSEAVFASCFPNKPGPHAINHSTIKKHPRLFKTP